MHRVPNTGSAAADRMDLELFMPNTSFMYTGIQVVIPSRRVPCKIMASRMGISGAAASRCRAEPPFSSTFVLPPSPGFSP